MMAQGDSMKCRKTLVIKGPRAGLGDLLRAVAVGVLYANATHRRLCIDWRDGYYSEPGKNPFPEVFRISGIPVLEECPDSGTVAPAVWQGHLDRSISELVMESGWEWDRAQAIQRFSIDVTKLNYDEDHLVVWEFDQLKKLAEVVLPGASAWHPWIERLVFRRYFRRYVRLQPDVAAMIEACKKESFSPRMIGVHVRYGSDARSGQRVPMEVYEAHLAGLLRCYPDAGIFLAADQAAAVAHLRAKFPRVTTLAKVLPASGESLHISADVKDRAQSFRNALMDIWLLGECDFLLFPAESSFGTVAGCIGRSRLRHTYPLSSNSRWRTPLRQGLHWAAISKAGLWKKLRRTRPAQP
jgi:hypothetical protein